MENIQFLNSGMFIDLSLIKQPSIRLIKYRHTDAESDMWEPYDSSIDFKNGQNTLTES
jgi:hypothetical protein